MLCIRCYPKKKVEMIYIGETKPRLTEEEKYYFEATGVPILGKKKWKCPDCGHIRVGDWESGIDMMVREAKIKERQKI